MEPDATQILRPDPRVTLLVFCYENLMLNNIGLFILQTANNPKLQLGHITHI
jgi:hypothetical protein